MQGQARPWHRVGLIDPFDLLCSLDRYRSFDQYQLCRWLCAQAAHGVP